MMVPPPVTQIACFGKNGGPEKHYRAARNLYNAGVWIGYLSQDKHSESYRGLPSFSQLRLNGKNFNPPYPPPVSGVASEQRQAVCRGCYDGYSKFIPLKEIAFITKTKLVIMPLFDDKGSKGDDLFCILVTQPTDRSLPGLQSYRPYEIRGSGQGKEFTNDFVLLAVRNSSLTNGTLETIQNVLNRALSSDDSYKTPPSVESSKGISTDSSLDVPEQLNTPKNGDENPTKRVQTRLRTGSGATATTEFAPDVESVGIFDRLDWIRKQQKLERMKARENDARMKRKPSDVDDDSEAQSKRLNTEEAPFTRTQQLTPASPGSAAMSPQREESTPTLDRPSTSHQRPGLIDTEKSASPSFSRHQSIVITSPAIHSRLTEEQAKRVRIIWTVFVDDDIECDFERGLDECETFSDLLNLFREDTELDPQAAAALTNTKLWRIMYQLPGHARKAFNVRVGNEVAFERFQEALAQSSIWNDSPGVRFDIQLRALN